MTQDNLEKQAKRKAAARADYLKHADAYKARARAWRESNSERKKLLDKEWRRNNAERKAANDRAWYEKNIEHKREYDREWSVGYRLANKHKWAADAAKRRARTLEATPLWADMSAIRSVYLAASLTTAVVGEQYEVDHIVPLRGKHVCGLHVRSNLRIILKRENRSKGNRYDCG